MRKKKIGQVAIEYMLTLGLVVGVTLLAFPTTLGRIRCAACQHFFECSNAIIGDTGQEADIDASCRQMCRY